MYATAGGSFVDRVVARWRASICPVDRVIAAVPAGSRVLDIGCGRGMLLVALALSGAAREGLGVDPSTRAIALARAVANKLRAVRGASDGMALCFAVGFAGDADSNDTFDVVTMVDVMHHLPRETRDKAISMAANALRDGGIFVYKDVCIKPWWRRAANRLHDLAMARQWIHEEPVEHVEAWARSAGFTLERSERIDMLWYGHELRVFRKVAADDRAQNESVTDA